ncbi:dihydrofolate reductase family protein [Rapidithrix thailandica]|uniref:Dihydrofolate reductase family protein n=1 Tax=Rapidithrix thailandica TaxID=413964 RepID=A0AAW9RWR0_9BACT
MPRKVILYIAMSLDGYIAKEDDNIDFLSIVSTQGEDFGYAEFQQNIDTLIWGRKTYDKVLSFGIDFPHKDKKCYVLSNTKQGKDENVEFIQNVEQLIKRLQQEPGKDIYCDGGGALVFELLSHALIDRLIISIIPHLLGNGIRLFRDGRPEQNLKFKKSITFPSGLVQLWYDKD